MTREKEVQIANFEEQYHSIRRNRDEANKELSAVLAEKEREYEALKLLIKDRERLEGEVGELRERLSSLTVELSLVDKQLLRSLVSLEEHRKAFKEEVEELKKSFEVEKESLREKSRTISLGNILAERKMQTLKEEIDLVEADLQRKKEEASQVGEEVKELKAHRDELAETNLSVSYKLELLKEEEKNLEKSLQEKSDSASRFKEGLLDAREQITRRIKDVLILENRIRERYEKMGMKVNFKPIEVPEVPEHI